MQKEIVVRCRQAGKPVIVASHLLQSMIEYPTPTRAEVCFMLHPLHVFQHGVLSCTYANPPVLGFSKGSVSAWLRSNCTTQRAVVILQVADISDVVRQRADALMLSGESAAGAYPDKAIGVLRAVATRIEEWCRYVLLELQSFLGTCENLIEPC